MSVRLAMLEDAPAIARIQVETWRVAYRDILPNEMLAALSIEKRTERWRTWMKTPDTHLYVAEDGAIVGFAHVGPSRDEGAENTHEIYAIYIDVAHWRKGHGRALLRACIDDACGKKITLWVIEKNAPARAFYEATGFAFDGAKKIEDGITEVRHSREPSGTPA